MSEWEATCRKRLALALTWDQSDRANRSDVRAWRRRLFWARWGHVAAAPIGSALGVAIGLVVVHFVN